MAIPVELCCCARPAAARLQAHGRTGVRDERRHDSAPVRALSTPEPATIEDHNPNFEMELERVVTFACESSDL